MARKIDEIYLAILQEKNLHTELDELNSTSKVAVFNLWAYIVAVVMWTLENLFDQHKAERKIISTGYYRRCYRF